MRHAPQVPNKSVQPLPQVSLASLSTSTENLPLPPTSNQMILQSPTTPAATPTQLQLLHPTSYPAMATLIHFAGDSMAQNQLISGSKQQVQGQNQVVAMTTVTSQQQLIQAAASQLQTSYAGMPVPLPAMSFSMPLAAGVADASQHMSSTGVPHIAMTPVPISAYSLATPLQSLTTSSSTVPTVVNTAAPHLPMVNLNAGIAMPQMHSVHQHVVPTGMMSQNGTNDSDDDEEEVEEEEEEEEEEEIDEEEEEELEELDDEELENDEEEHEESAEKEAPLEQEALVSVTPKGEVKVEKVPNQVLSCCVEPAACEVTIESAPSRSPSVSPSVSPAKVEVQVEAAASECLNGGKKKTLTYGSVELGREMMRNQLKAPTNGITKK